MVYSRRGQPMAHAPNVVHCMIRSSALHPCYKNKLSLKYSFFFAFHISCTSLLGNFIFFTLICLKLKICLINQKRWYFELQSSNNYSIRVSYMCVRELPGVCPAVSHHRLFTTEGRFSRVRRCAQFFIC